MSNRSTYIIAGILLLAMFLMAIFSIRDDSLTFDETAHIAAGYSYLTQRDMRLNPEHPPLIKDLAGLPLLFLNFTPYRNEVSGARLNFPKDHPSWVQDDNPVWWHQFEFASQFLYYSGNNPDQILLWSRLPMIFLLIFLGWFLFFWARELFGNKTALLSLFLFSFSPTFLAHGRLVTTDVGAALGVVIATYFWLKFLKNPTKKNIILAGLTFGVAMLLKFSLILLIPFFAIITLVYASLKNGRKYIFNILKYLGLALLVGIIGMVFIVWPIYQYHVLEYRAERQVRDTQFLLSTTAIPKPLATLNIWMVSNPILKPFGQYLLGLLLAVNRSSTGHTTYFLGEISAAGRKNYFPTVYLLKEPLTFHILTIIALLYAAWLVKRPFWVNAFRRTKDWVKSHFTGFAMILFIGIYWLVSLKSNLNIGVRHLLPVFPFTIVLVSALIIDWLKPPFVKIKHLILGLLVLWQAISVISIYPHFLAYFNEIAGGPDRGYIYTVNSNLDWGQDLKRLKNWVDEKNIDKIYIDYFGGGDAKYYLKEKFAPWWGQKDPKELPKGSYLAVSVTFLQGGRGEPGPGFEQPTGYYQWLSFYQPVAKIGYSIFVYQIDPAPLLP